MLTRRDGGRCRMVTHYEHAELSGALAERWGNARFAAPEARSSFVLAVAHHDDAWKAADDLPRYAAEQRGPMHFIDLPIGEHDSFYGDVARGLADVDPYASVLVGMHWVGLYNHRWGIREPRFPMPPPPVLEAMRAMTEAEEARWAQLKRDVWGTEGRRSVFETVLWHDFDVLEALDGISLALCLLDPEQLSGDAPPVQVDATLRPWEQPPGPRSIENVPVAPGGEVVQLTLSVVERGTVAVDPFPFDEPAVEVRVPARSLPDREYASADDLTAAYRDADVVDLTWRVVAP